MTKRLLVFLALIFVCARTTAAQDRCPGPDVTIKVGDTIARPEVAKAATAVDLRDKNGMVIPGGTNFRLGAIWTQGDITNLSGLLGGATTVQMLWSQDGKSCFQFVSMPPAVPAPVNIGAPPQELPTGTNAVGTGTVRRGRPAYTDLDCGKAGAEWRAQIARERSELDIRRVTILVFRGESGACYQNNERPTQGDPIYVGVFTDDPLVWTGTADFQPCSIEPSAPSVLVTDRVNVGPITEAKEWYLVNYLPRRCWNPSVAVTVTGQMNHRINYTVAQATRYRATLHLGAVFSENHDVTFGLRPDGTGANRIFTQGPTNKGPDYVASLVFYAIPRYFAAMGSGKSAYPGRDPVRDNGFADKLGAVIGVGLRDPRERFNFGFAFELAAGVNVLGVWDYAQTNVLAGVKEGDVFAGQATEIPTTKQWQHKFVMGLSLDLVYVSTALKR